GDSRLALENASALGLSLRVQASAQRFINPIRRYFDGISGRYRSFRRERQVEGKWYTKDGFGPSEASPLEVDIILLTVLRRMRRLLDDRRIVRDLDRYPVLRASQGLYKTQVAVDEATDFSPIQLACMASLCDPATHSFVACGDFNQRLTEWGTRAESDL